MTLDDRLESDLLDMWLLWERGNWYLNDDHPNYDKEHDRRFRDAIVEYITKLIADEVKKAYKRGVKDGWKESGEGYNYEYAGLSTIDPDKVGDDIANRLAELKSTQPSNTEGDKK